MTNVTDGLKTILTLVEAKKVVGTEKVFETETGFGVQDYGKYRPNITFLIGKEFDEKPFRIERDFDQKEEIYYNPSMWGEKKDEYASYLGQLKNYIFGGEIEQYVPAPHDLTVECDFTYGDLEIPIFRVARCKVITEYIDPTVFVEEDLGNINIIFGGKTSVIYGNYWKSPKGTNCFRIKKKEASEHMLIRIGWGGAFSSSHGIADVPEGSLYYHRASSNGGNLGADYMVLPKSFRRIVSEDDI